MSNEVEAAHSASIAREIEGVLQQLETAIAHARTKARSTALKQLQEAKFWAEQDAREWKKKA